MARKKRDLKQNLITRLWASLVLITDFYLYTSAVR